MVLTDSAGHTLELAEWSWGTLHELVANGGVFSKELWAPLRDGGGPGLSAQGVQVLITFMELELLSKVRVGERIFINGTVGAELDDGPAHSPESDRWRHHYSLTHGVLSTVLEFLKSSGGAVTLR